MKQFTGNAIGTITKIGGTTRIELEESFRPALKGLEGFQYVQVLWWFDGCDDTASRSVRTVPNPYRGGPEELGVFATRSPERPNPLALSCAEVTDVDLAAGTVGLVWLDADPGSPVLDLKPYTPSLDRVESPRVPDWCAHWPGSVEVSGDFNWAAEFLF